MMNPMRGHPEDRAAFERHRSANRKEVLDPLRNLVRAVRQQPVITQPDAEADAAEVHQKCRRQQAPAKAE